MLNEERCLLNYEISFEWILYPMSRSVPLIARAQELNYSSTMLSNPPTSASVVHSSLLLHIEPRVSADLLFQLLFGPDDDQESLKGPTDILIIPRHSLLDVFFCTLGYCIHLRVCCVPPEFIQLLQLLLVTLILRIL